MRCGCALAILLAGNVQASTVKGMRFWQSPERTRVVLDLSGPVQQEVFTLKDPDRVVIDLPNTGFSLKLDAVKIDSDLVSRVRKSVRGDGDTLRLVLDLKRPAKAKAFLLKPYLQYGHRLVIDLSDGSQRPATSGRAPRAGDVIIAVDAGHGGEDPGAIGHSGKKEKYITLAIAKALVSELNKKQGVTAFLTRSGDYYIGLRKRTELARKKRAHLFVSIHADAFKDKRVRGASVWTLSTKGSNSELGKWLESRENVDLLGVADDVDLAQFDAQVAEVLVSLSLEYALGSSIEMASKVLRQVGRINKLHSKQPRQAAFVVLKQPSVPSILVETGFISNPTDEKNLSSPNFQRKLARALAQGVWGYLAEHPPEGTKLALAKRSRPIRHRVHRGDTLSGIAKSYGVSVREIQQANDLRSSSVRAGQTLIIPRS
jgi:N-acetylmuramoyl-L-alanine amidase